MHALYACIETHTCMSAYTYIHTYTHTYIHTHIHTHIHTTVLEITVGHWPFFDHFQHLVSQISCTFSMGRQSVTYKISYFQKNGRPTSDPLFLTLHTHTHIVHMHMYTQYQIHKYKHIYGTHNNGMTKMLFITVSSTHGWSTWEEHSEHFTFILWLTV